MAGRVHPAEVAAERPGDVDIGRMTRAIAL